MEHRKEAINIVMNYGYTKREAINILDGTYVEFEHPCQRYEGIIADYCEIPNLPVNI